MNETTEPFESQDSGPQGIGTRSSTLLLVVVICVAVVGYFVGLSDGVPSPQGLNPATVVRSGIGNVVENGDPKLIFATSYADIPTIAMGPTAAWKATVKQLPAQNYDLFAEIKLSPLDKQDSNTVRASRRAFNGAPPIIPHAINGTSDAACYACHSQGAKLGELTASVMSHRFLANCTQCHAPPAPAPFSDENSEVETSFIGLPAPTQGKRAYTGAPPTIPHSQWMRENCHACHSGPNGWPGMESTHPWRTNCTQCHAPSAMLDQAVTAP